jgi:hypothetical protein
MGNEALDNFEFELLTNTKKTNDKGKNNFFSNEKKSKIIGDKKSTFKGFKK